MSKKEISIPEEIISNKIHLIREQKVMLDKDLAELYQVETKQLKRQVRRNIDRFPEDFMIELDQEEFTNLRSQSGTSKWGGTRYAPMAFTEQGVAMLSSVLSSPTAIKVNIQIIRVFTKIREVLKNHSDLLLRMEKLERNTSKHDMQISQVFDLIKQLVKQEEAPRTQIGYKKDNK
jgi:hypothetical protein